MAYRLILAPTAQLKKKLLLMHYFKSFLWLITCLFSYQVTHSQETEFKRNDAYLEFGGPGIFGSINYERQLFPTPSLGIRLGLGFSPSAKVGPAFPIGLNYLLNISKNRSFLDMGITLTPIIGLDNTHIAYLPSIGFRRHTTQHWMFRMSYTPIINQEIGFFPWMSICIGKRF